MPTSHQRQLTAQSCALPKETEQEQAYLNNYWIAEQEIENIANTFKN